jgi:hypothetical protein
LDDKDALSMTCGDFSIQFPLEFDKGSMSRFIAAGAIYSSIAFLTSRGGSDLLFDCIPYFVISKEQ